MSITDELLKNKGYRAQLEKLSPETITLIASDRNTALEAARKGIEQCEPYQINNLEYLEIVADEMQDVAQAFLRGK